ncbi:MAG: ArsR/SmtB family transcription factor [Candidatus Thorarchaeota archaeon]
MTLPELLSDPVRARIYVEVLLRRETTAEELRKIVKVSRSTISHHLTKFVEENVLNIRLGSEKYKRNMKYYSINPDFSEEMIIDCKEDPDGTKKKAFLESSAAHLQVISNLMLERIDSSKKRSAVTFTFNFLSDEDAKVWMEEFQIFQKRVQAKCFNNSRVGAETEFSYIAFGGLTPVG